MFSFVRNHWLPRVGLLVEELNKGPAVLRLSYVADVESQSLVEQRLEAMKDRILTAWDERNGGYDLEIEPEIFWRLGGPPAIPKGADQ